VVKLAISLNASGLGDFHNTRHSDSDVGITCAMCSYSPTPESYTIAQFIVNETGYDLLAYEQAGVPYAGAIEDYSNLFGIPAVTCEALSNHRGVEYGTPEMSYNEMRAFLRYFGFDVDEMPKINLEDPADIMAAFTSPYNYNPSFKNISYERTFTALQEIINNASKGSTINLEHDYDYDLGFAADGINIKTDGITINGNGHTINANGQSRIFMIQGTDITINNLTFTNSNQHTGSALYIKNDCFVTTNDVVFANSTAGMGVIFVANGGKYVSNNDRIIDSTTNILGVVCLYNATGEIHNAFMMSSKELTWGFVQCYQNSVIRVYDSIFVNTTSRYSTAINGDKIAVIRNCTFINLHANLTAGAVAFKNGQSCVIEDCTFENVSSEKNGGALFLDVGESDALINIAGCSFDECYSGFGGAIMQLSGFLNINNCNFTDNAVLFDGGAIYTSCSGLNISDSIFINNCALLNESRGSFGGAIFFDNGSLILDNCTLANSSAKCGGAVYLYDAHYVIVDTAFDNNINFDDRYDDIFSMFDDDSPYLEGNLYSGENSTSLDNEDYSSIDINPGVKLVLLNNTIDIDAIPSKFDLRDWGWVTPVRDQGMMGSCWAFGASGAMESAILRYLGYEIDISENNMVDASLKYSRYGDYRLVEGASPIIGAHYALSWFGAFSSEYDTYDELGKISPLIATNSTIHFQDVVFIPVRNNATDNDHIKEAILKYGALEVAYESAQIPPYLNKDTAAQYCDVFSSGDHCVTLIGWDDSYPATNFNIIPPGDGAWIIKNSWGEESGINGYYYISYYDATFATAADSFAYLLFNTEEYNKNYQYDIQGELSFFNESDEYRNNFVALDDDLIAGVGTYFNDTNVEYCVEIYVNDELKLSQNGVSPFAGFHTIPLNSFIPIKKDNVFSVKIKSNSVPISENSRQHYLSGVSQYFENGTWVDATEYDGVCSLKVYTLADDTKIINNENIAVDYSGGKYFSVKVVTADGRKVGAGASVKFKINGKTYKVKTNKNGIAKIKITQTPGKYTIKTTYKGKTVKNTVTVKQVLKALK
jgi:C1A family cysteine protease